MASPGLIAAAVVGSTIWGSIARNKQMKAKAGATNDANNAMGNYLIAKEDARNKNQAPDTDALNRARQMSIANLRQSSGRASTFLSQGNMLGG